MLTSAKHCKNGTISGNLRNTTQEGKKETRQITPFFHLFFELNCLCYWFLYSKNWQNSFSWDSHFGPFWSAKYLNFGGKKLWDQNFMPFDSRNINIQRSKKTGFTFSIELKTNSKIFRFIPWSKNASANLLQRQIRNCRNCLGTAAAIIFTDAFGEFYLGSHSTCLRNLGIYLRRWLL